MISAARIYDLVESHKLFNLKFIKKSTGDMVEINNATCTSSSYKHGTINIKLAASGEIRKIKVFSIIEFNGTQVYI